ncbi:GlxA family transcriptional regulator [Paraburkholderia rhynchosiae]|nr:helix-turn-helix domain-containing protein [Paraburkholderia rhynchosiae]
MEAQQGQRQVVLVLSDGFSLTQMGRLVEVFNTANRLSGASAPVGEDYAIHPVSSGGGAVRSSSGVPIWTRAVEDHHFIRVHALFVIAGAALGHDEHLLSWLSDVYPRTETVQGLGGGARLIVLAGLTQKATATDGPLEVQPSAFDSTADGDGSTALVNALNIVKHDHGGEIASAVAQALSPMASQKIARPPLHEDEDGAQASESIRAAAHQMRVGSEARVSISAAARAAAMSERNFLRRFKKELGVTPSEFVLRIRLEKACYMLVETDLPTDKIARRTGLGSGDRLAKLFRQHLAMSPTGYRASERQRLAASGSLKSHEIAAHEAGHE